MLCVVLQLRLGCKSWSRLPCTPGTRSTLITRIAAVDGSCHHIGYQHGLNYGAPLFPSTAAEQHNLSSTLRDHSQCLQRMDFYVHSLFSVQGIFFLAFLTNNV